MQQRWNILAGLALLLAPPVAAQEIPIIKGPKDLTCYVGETIFTRIEHTTADPSIPADSVQEMRVIMRIMSGANYSGFLSMLLRRNPDWMHMHLGAGENLGLDRLFDTYNDELEGYNFAIPCTWDEFGALPTGGYSGAYASFDWIHKTDRTAAWQAEQAVLTQLRQEYGVNQDSLQVAKDSLIAAKDTISRR